MAMRERSFMALGTTGFYRVAYTEWGSVDAPRTVVCVHGLTRNCRDFDEFARALAGRGWRVVCPDMPGRGDSDWLHDPVNYDVPAYCAVMAALLARLDVPDVDWVGTSMGGIIGMALAAQPRNPIRRLVLNDVGAFLPKDGLARIREYVGREMTHLDLVEVEAYLRKVLAGYGPLSDAQWRALAETSAHRGEDAKYSLRYDPKIGDVIRTKPPEDVDLWPLWQNVRRPVLLLRGGCSDVLPAEVAEEMTRRGPTCRLVTLPECGHAPSLMASAQIKTVADWLEAPG
jgi:pimeloyl-ACP methyl ester carboxylesterase